MSKGCVIKYTNPVTGMNQTSVLAYTLSQVGYSNEQAIDLVKQGSLYSKKDGYNTWPKPLNKDKGRFGNFVEIDSDNLLRNVGIDSLTSDQVKYLRAAQDLFEDVQVRIDNPINLTTLVEIGNYVKNNGLASVGIEIVNPEAPVLERMYKVYPIPLTELNLVYLSSFIEGEVFNKRLVNGEESRIEFLKKYVDFQNPDVYDTLVKILNDPETPDYEKFVIKKLLPIIDLIPTIGLDFFTGKDLQNRDVIPMGEYVPELHKIKLNVFGLKNRGLDYSRRVILHEILHSVLSSTLQNPTSEIDKELVNSLKPILAYYQQKYSTKKRTDTYYGFKDIHEFVSEFFTNPDFRNTLESEEPNWFIKIIDAIFKFFGKKLNLNQNPNSLENIDLLMENFFNEILLAQDINTSIIYTKFDSIPYTMSVPQMLEMDTFVEENSDFLTRLDELLQD